MTVTKREIESYLSNIGYKPGWAFREVLEKGDGFLIQLRFPGTDVDTGARVTLSGRKWFVSRHSVETEVVRTAWKAILAAEEHEAAENFTYHGAPIYNPHLYVGDLARAITEGSVKTDSREEPRSGGDAK